MFQKNCNAWRYNLTNLTCRSRFLKIQTCDDILQLLHEFCWTIHCLRAVFVHFPKHVVEITKFLATSHDQSHAKFRGECLKVFVHSCKTILHPFCFSWHFAKTYGYLKYPRKFSIYKKSYFPLSSLKKLGVCVLLY